MPGAVAVLFVVLAVVLVEVDVRTAEFSAFAVGPDAARQILSAIAGSLITVAGLAFSITIVSLQLVSTQYSPRALRNFLRDRLNQIVAGVFLGTFAYCLLVLSTVRSGGGNGDPEFVPGISVNVGIGMAVLALALLLVFIHHMSQAIQVTRITAEIARSGLDAVDRLYPEGYRKPPGEHWQRLIETWTDAEDPTLVYARRPGFVASVGVDELVEAVSRREKAAGNGIRGSDATGGRGGSHRDEVRVDLRATPGDFVTAQTVLAAVWPSRLGEEEYSEVRRAVVIAEERDIEHDAAYAIRQLVDIALRAISPAVNDPTTAVDCVGYTQAIMERIAGRDLPERVRTFPDAAVTVIVRRREFDDLVEEAFAELGRYADKDPRVVVRLLGALERTADALVAAGARERLPVVMETADGIGQRAMAEVETDHDRSSISEALDRVRRVQALRGDGGADSLQPPGGRESSPGG